MAWKYTSAYCLKCAHPHRFMVDGKTAGDCPNRDPKTGRTCKCRKFKAIPSGNVRSLQEWKDKHKEPDPPPFSPVRMRVHRKQRRLWLVSGTPDEAEGGAA